MRSSRLLRHGVVWLASAAVLASGLLPWIAHARGIPAAAGWVEICTAQGSKWVQADDGAPDGSGDPAAASRHHPCALCSMQAEPADVPPTVVPVVPVVASGPREPAPADNREPATPEVRGLAEPRGPPRLS